MKLFFHEGLLGGVYGFFYFSYLNIGFIPQLPFPGYITGVPVAFGIIYLFVELGSVIIL